MYLSVLRILGQGSGAKRWEGESLPVIDFLTPDVCMKCILQSPWGWRSRTWSEAVTGLCDSLLYWELKMYPSDSYVLIDITVTCGFQLTPSRTLLPSVTGDHNPLVLSCGWDRLTYLQPQCIKTAVIGTGTILLVRYRSIFLTRPLWAKWPKSFWYFLFFLLYYLLFLNKFTNSIYFWLV